MSIPTEEHASKFLAPLRGNLAILILHDARAKLPLCRFLLRCASLKPMHTTVLDADAFYCTNVESFAADIQRESNGEVLLLPEQDFKVSSLLPLLSSKIEFLIVDDLNSIYSLASEGHKAQQLTILMRLLSHNARMNGTWAIATAYRTEFGQRQGSTNQRSLTALGDLLIDTDFQGGSFKLKARFEGHWPNGEFKL